MSISNKRNKKGFTLAEMLMTVAILLIVLALAMPAIFTLVKNLKQQEMDAKAETIYTAVQNRLTELYAKGNTDAYNPDIAGNGVSRIDGVPGDYENDEVTQSIYYVMKGSTVSSAILDGSVISDDLKNGTWVVEYIPKTAVEKNSTDQREELTAASVYGVYYSDDNTVSAYQSDGRVSKKYLEDYRGKENRRDDGDCKIGYYGGSNVNSGSNTSSLTVSDIKINSNDEINTAVVTVRRPIGLSADKLTFSFTLKDAFGNSYVMQYKSGNWTQVVSGVSSSIGNAKNFLKVENKGLNVVFTITLDNLSKQETRFDSLFGSKSNHSSKLVAGSDLQLTAKVECSDKKIKSDEKSTIGNSIFGYEENTLFTTSDTAKILCARHLQNLDESSGVNKEIAKKITTAKIMKDISFAEGSAFYDAYKDSYYNNRFTVQKILQTGAVKNITVPNFESINNNQLTSLIVEKNKDTNAYYHVYNLSTNQSGLFSTVSSNLTVTGLQMVGERVYGSGNSGGIIGTITGGTVTLTDCAVYLDSENNDIPSTILRENYLDAVRWIQGSTVGGLVGRNEGRLNIEKSFASSVLGSDGSTTGGLVGENLGPATINIAYADSYLYGKNVGGLVGKNTVATNLTITNAYSAGFIGLDLSDDSIGAGLVNGQAAVTGAYTIIAPFNHADTAGIDTNKTDLQGKYYATLQLASGSDIYYLRGNVNTDNISGIGSQLEKTTTPSDLFAINPKQKLDPYNLMGQSLTTYEYARLKDLPHYGDWSADFIPGSLVYYEQYSDGSYGIDGGNLKSTLSKDLKIVGDGYAIMYQQGEVGIPSSVRVSVDGSNYTIETASANFTKEIDGKQYNIYTLPKEVMNPEHAIEHFYEEIQLTPVMSAKASGETKPYYFNPHFAKAISDVNTIPSTVTIRSPRQLYSLAKYFDDGYNALKTITFKQDRDLVYSSYQWEKYTSYGNVTKQNPIGSSSSFEAKYDGSCYAINDVNFYTENGSYLGMFGQIGKSGSVSNVVLATQYTSNGTNYTIQRKNPVGANQVFYGGVLAGKNQGTITNCAAAGYYLSKTNTANGTIYGYANSSLYVGGLVGFNEGTIKNCSSDHPMMNLRMDNAKTYAGGLVGYNDTKGDIFNCYALTHIVSNASNGKTVIAGFAAYNAGSITQSYCASAMTAEGSGNRAYAFGSKEGNGTTKQSYYLSQGTYRFVNDMYSYDRGTSLQNTNINTNESTGIPVTHERLAQLSTGSQATVSNYCGNSINEQEKNYPFRAVIRNIEGNLVHYGEWLVKPELGIYGVFYWEHEEGGNNEGYKISYLGLDINNSQLFQKSTLCGAHDDGGVVTDYGYGYFVSNGYEGTVSLSTENIQLNQDIVDVNAKSQLETQMPGFTFVPFKTDDANFRIDGDNINGKFTLDVNGNPFTFNISPFFADAMSFANDKNYAIKDVDAKYVNTTPGIDQNYQIRSVQQLQYMNWNSSTLSTNQIVMSSGYENFNYLMYTTIRGTGTQTKQNAGHADNVNLKFVQSHDLNAGSIQNFTPIAGQGTSSTNGYNAMLYAWFGGSYDGQSYKIQELNITSSSFTVGLFGTTAGANISNIIMYSQNGATIQRSTTNTDTPGAYAIGGLIGIAYDYNASAGSNVITNCAIAGYRIVDDSHNQQTLGEANIGGLIGVANTSLEKCSAVTDIIIQCTHENTQGYFTKARWGNFIRVGGLTGATQYTIENCYTGGSIHIDNEDLLNESYTGDNKLYSKYVNQYNDKKSKVNANSSTNIYIAGISGSGFAMNYQNFTNQDGLKEGSPTVKNSYTYMDFPAIRGTIRSISMITSFADRYSEGEKTNQKIYIENCYYLESKANFDVSQLPNYYFNSSCPSDLIKDAGYQQAMINGDTKWMNKLINNKDVSSNGTGSKLDLHAISYKELSRNQQNGLSQNRVTIIDQNQQKIDGKYSFNAGDTALSGMNYPFPTVITQNDVNGPVNVHYGAWPFDGAYWENGSTVMNLFSNLDPQGVSVKQFKILKNQDTSIEEAFQKRKLQITGDTEYIEPVQSADITRDTDGNYLVTIRAKKAGAVKITASWPDQNREKEAYKEAYFTLSITDEFSIDTNNIDVLSMKTNDTQSIQMYAKSLENNITIPVSSWNIEVSKEIDDSGDITVSDISDTNDGKKQFTITSHGTEATVLISATTQYQGIAYTSTKRITITKADFVGLSNGEIYNEATIDLNASKDIFGENTFYSQELHPKNESMYFLYEPLSMVETNDVLENIVDMKVVDAGGNEVLNANVTRNDATSDEYYKYVSITVDTEAVTSSLENATLRIRIMNGTNYYVLSVPLIVPSNETTSPLENQTQMDVSADSQETEEETQSSEPTDSQQSDTEDMNDASNEEMQQ